MKFKFINFEDTFGTNEDRKDIRRWRFIFFGGSWNISIRYLYINFFNIFDIKHDIILLNKSKI